MPFVLAEGHSRLTSGATPALVWKAMAAAIGNAGIVDKSRLSLVMDDEGLPPKTAPDDRFITVRYPSLIWEHGKVMTGDNSRTLLSSLMVKGQSRHTLWLQSDRDLYGSAESLADDAMAAPPDGDQLLGQMVALFFDQDLVNGAGNALTNRPLELISIDMPPDGPTAKPWKPFRVTWEIGFTWDLSRGG